MENQQKVVDTESEENARRYLLKTDPWSSHSIIFRWLATLPAGSRILDIGTASGILGKECAGSGWIVNGIEPVRLWADEARPYYNQILCTDIASAPDEFLRGSDVIVCADVLEHLPNPESQLSRLVNLQKPGTQFLISVPNVANIWVRINLLFGKFDYTEKGILDRTHLRFFTRKTFKSFLSTADLKVIELKYSPIPLNVVNSFFENSPLGRFIFGTLNLLTQAFPTLLAYQFVARTEVSMKESEN